MDSPVQYDKYIKYLLPTCLWFGLVVVFNATFNNISVISWISVLLVEDTGVPGENHRPATSHHIIWCRVHIAMNGIQIHNFNSDMHWLQG